MDVQAVAADLREERARLVEERERHERALEDTAGTPIDDVVREIDRALERIGIGSYGTCARCGDAIASERLEALPYAVCCFPCANRAPE